MRSLFAVQVLCTETLDLQREYASVEQCATTESNDIVAVMLPDATCRGHGAEYKKLISCVQVFADHSPAQAHCHADS